VERLKTIPHREKIGKTLHREGGVGPRHAEGEGGEVAHGIPPGPRALAQGSPEVDSKKILLLYTPSSLLTDAQTHGQMQWVSGLRHLLRKSGGSLCVGYTHRPKRGAGPWAGAGLAGAHDPGLRHVPRGQRGGGIGRGGRTPSEAKGGVPRPSGRDDAGEVRRLVGAAACRQKVTPNPYPTQTPL